MPYDPNSSPDNQSWYEANSAGDGVKRLGSTIGGWFEAGHGNDANRNGLNTFAGQAAGNYAQGTQNLNQSADYLRSIASGQHSVSAEQLRQGLQQNLAAQQSMAAGAPAQNQAMAARQAMMNSGRLGAGLAGQQALAGLQERQQAQQALSQQYLQQRQQDLQGTLTGYDKGMNPDGDKSAVDKYGGAVIGGLKALFSDRRLKTEIEDGDEKSKRLLNGLKAYTYKYKDEKFGKGEQLGVMAQDLEKAGLKQAVIDTPVGKRVDVGKLAGGLAAMLAGVNRRVSKLEGDGE